MRNTHSPKIRFRLTDRSGQVRAFSSLSRLSKHLVGKHRDERLDELVGDDHTVARYIVRAESGETLCGLTLSLILAGRPSGRYGPRPALRAGPWPGSARGRCHRGAYYRRVRTKAALTAQAAPDETADLAQPPRPRAIPTAWDDIPRNDDRSWKRHRATQYK